MLANVNINDLSPEARKRLFYQEHGEYVVVENMSVFADGAKCERAPYGIMVDAPSDPHELAKAILRFWKVKLNRAVARFNSLHSELQIVAKTNKISPRCSPPPSHESLEQLRQLKKTIADYHTKYQQAEKAVEDSIPENVKLRQKQDDENREKNEQFLDELSSIEI